MKSELEWGGGLADHCLKLAFTHRLCNMRAITRRNSRAKSHPEALNATISCVTKEKAPRKAMLF
jgi:hypothetical protein